MSKKLPPKPPRESRIQTLSQGIGGALPSFIFMRSLRAVAAAVLARASLALVAPAARPHVVRCGGRTRGDAASTVAAPAVRRPHLVRCRGKTRGDGPSEAAAGEDDVYGEGKEAEAMKVGELTAELDLRGVDYSDCVEADELRVKLREARLSGRASPDVLDEFNRKRAEAMVDPAQAVDASAMSEEDLAGLRGSDGGIPGGLAPDEIFKLMNDPEIMTMLQKPKFQEIMKDVMGGGGQGALQKHMLDPESRDMLLKLTTLLKDAGMVPPVA